MELFWIGFFLMIAGVVVLGILPELIKIKPANRVFFYIGGFIIGLMGALLAAYAALDEWPAAL
tara:strand:+ start:685 stop:873 length:189 start_codon:yes stop_codon:yes gene_type:complete